MPDLRNKLCTDLKGDDHMGKNNTGGVRKSVRVCVRLAKHTLFNIYLRCNARYVPNQQSPNTLWIIAAEAYARRLLRLTAAKRFKNLSVVTTDIVATLSYPGLCIGHNISHNIGTHAQAQPFDGHRSGMLQRSAISLLKEQ